MQIEPVLTAELRPGVADYAIVKRSKLGDCLGCTILNDFLTRGHDIFSVILHPIRIYKIGEACNVRSGAIFATNVPVKMDIVS